MRNDNLSSEFQKIDEEAGLLDRLIMIKKQRSLVSIELRAAVFLGFRHFIRHAYRFFYARMGCALSSHP